MSEFNLFTILALAVVCFSASTLSTAIGFGMNIILLSIFQFLLPPVQLVAMATALGLANAMIRMVGLRHIDTRGATGRILIAGILGVPCGTAVLLLAPADLMKLFFSALVIVSALMLIMPSSIGASHGAMPRVKQGQIIFGALGGFTAGAAGMPGPPVVWCGLRQNWDKSEAHAVFARFFVATGLATLLILWQKNAYDHRTVVVSMGLIPVVALGVFIGTKLRHRMSQAQFRRFAAWGLVVLGVLAAANTLLKMG